MYCDDVRITGTIRRIRERIELTDLKACKVTRGDLEIGAYRDPQPRRREDVRVSALEAGGLTVRIGHHDIDGAGGASRRNGADLRTVDER